MHVLIKNMSVIAQRVGMLSTNAFLHGSMQQRGVCSPLYRHYFALSSPSSPRFCAHTTSLHTSADAQSGPITRLVVRSTTAPAQIRRKERETEAAEKALATLADSPERYAQGAQALDSIVKVFTVYSRPDYFLPWQNHPKRESTGSGFVIRDRLILTNAHVVADHTYVAVKRHGSGTKHRAGKTGLWQSRSSWSSHARLISAGTHSDTCMRTDNATVTYPTTTAHITGMQRVQ